MARHTASVATRRHLAVGAGVTAQHGNTKAIVTEIRDAGHLRLAHASALKNHFQCAIAVAAKIEHRDSRGVFALLPVGGGRRSARMIGSVVGELAAANSGRIAGGIDQRTAHVEREAIAKFVARKVIMLAAAQSGQIVGVARREFNLERDLVDQIHER